MKRTKKLRKPKTEAGDPGTEIISAPNVKKQRTMKLRAPKIEKQVVTEKPDKKMKRVKTKKVPEPAAKRPSDNSDSEAEPPKIMKKTRSQTIIRKPSSDDSDSYAAKETLKAEPLPAGEESDQSEPEADAAKHKEDLGHLRRVDPEFYDFLKEHDSELLQFSDHETALEDDDDDKSQGDDVHVPGDLHGGSDESDFEDDDAAPMKGNVTLKMVKDLEAEFQKSKISLSTITKTVKMFHAAVLRVSSVDGATEGEFKVTGSGVFNEIINMCVLCLPNAIAKYLGFERSGKNPQKCKHFVKIKTSLIEYLTDLLELLSTVTSGNIQSTMLKHLHHLCKYVACFSRISKMAIKKLLPIWSSAKEETVRVLSFMCILRITRHNEATLIVPVLKAMFMTYIKNCKFVSPTTWPGINFMRRSLVEMFSMDLEQAYPHVFLYVRQLGIHLRNAIVVPKVEHKQAVFNWQYINALHLWAELVGQNGHHEGMKSLRFPIVMIISNTIKLGPTSQYYPLRFYLIEMLMMMEQDSGQFITIKPFFVDVITKFEINKKHKKTSMKPLDFSCIIRLSKSQMNESGFKDAVVEKLYTLLLEYCAYKSYKMVFPDTCVVLIVFFKELVEKCTNSNHKKKFKQLLDKILENNDFIILKRSSFKANLADINAIRAWEKQIKAQGTPLLTFYQSWSKVNRMHIIQKSFSKNEELAELMPLIIKQKVEDRKKLKANPKENGNPTDLFPSDSEDDLMFSVNDKTDGQTEKTDGQAEKNNVKAEQSKKKPKKKRINKKNIPAASASEDNEVDDKGDVVSEFNW